MADTSPRCSRRNFFPLLLQEIVVGIQTAKGKPAYGILSLDTLPDEQLATLCPIINPACRISVVDGQVCSQFDEQADTLPRAQFPTTPENLAVFNRFNGWQTLGEVAQSVAEELGWDDERAFQHTRALFLLLAKHLVAVPQNAPLDAGIDASP